MSYKYGMQKTSVRILCVLILIMVGSYSLFSQSHPSGTSLFNGQDLNDWHTVNSKFQDLWYVKDSAIHCGDGEVKIPANTYLHTAKEYENFEFRCLFRITGDPTTGMINSGIQYRSAIDDGKMIGYQADIGERYWGDLYDEHRRGELVDGKVDVLKFVLRPNDWNSYTIRVEGNHHQLFINGIQTVDYIEKDPEIPTKGYIAVQNHSGGNSHVEFRDVTITELP